MTAATSRAPRIALWDNARWLLLVLIVWGHLLNDLPEGSAAQRWMALLLYVFHIPALIFLSGYFASTDPRKSIVAVWRLALTWLVFEGIWALVRFATGAGPFPHSFLVIPGWTLWYLVTLIVLILVLPLILATRAPLIISVLISLLSGLLPAIGPQWSLSRTAYLLPIFVLGYLCRERGLLAARWFLQPSWGARIVAGAMLLTVGAAAWIARVPLEALGMRGWAAGYTSYEGMLAPRGLEPAWGILIRVGLLVAAVAMSLAFLLLVPRRRLFFTSWGGRTLYVYLLHTFVLRLIFASGILVPVAGLAIPMLVATGVIAVGLTILLSTTPVVRIARPVVEPPVSALLSTRKL